MRTLEAIQSDKRRLEQEEKKVLAKTKADVVAKMKEDILLYDVSKGDLRGKAMKQLMGTLAAKRKGKKAK